MTNDKQMLDLIGQYGEMVEYLPEAALAAIRTGGDWDDGHPDSVEGEDAWPYYCDDCATWHQNWHPKGLEVEKGKLIEMTWTVDQDGNWDINDGYEVGTEDHRKMMAGYAFAEWLKEWIAYYEWVIEEGKDPLDNFIVHAKSDKGYERKLRAAARRALRDGKRDLKKAKETK